MPRKTKPSPLPRVPGGSAAQSSRAFVADLDELLNAFRTGMLAAAGKIVDKTLTRPVDVCFPFMDADGDGFGGPPVSDPFALFVTLPGNDEEDDWGPTLQISLGDAVERSLDMWRNYTTRRVDCEEGRKSILRLRSCFALLVAMIDRELSDGAGAA